MQAIAAEERCLIRSPAAICTNRYCVWPEPAQPMRSVGTTGVMRRVKRTCDAMPTLCAWSSRAIRIFPCVSIITIRAAARVKGPELLCRTNSKSLAVPTVASRMASHGWPSRSAPVDADPIQQCAVLVSSSQPTVSDSIWQADPSLLQMLSCSHSGRPE